MVATVLQADKPLNDWGIVNYYQLINSLARDFDFNPLF